MYPVSNVPIEPLPTYSQWFRRAAAVVAGVCLLVVVPKFFRNPQSPMSLLRKQPVGVCTVVPPDDPTLVVVYAGGKVVDAGISPCDPFYASQTRPLYARDESGKKVPPQRLAMGVMDTCANRPLKVTRDSEVTTMIPVRCHQTPPIGSPDPNWPHPGVQ